MEVSIRDAVLGNMKGSDENSVYNTIQEAISDSKEVTLPGLGVIFEVYWKSIDENEKKSLASKISTSI